MRLRLDDRAAFANFHPGPNAEALAAARAAAVAGGRFSYVCLWGPGGAGKTHLLLAACRLAGELGRRSAYLSMAERAITPAAMDAIDGLDLLCLDDLQWLAGDHAREQRALALWERLRAAGATLLAAGTPAPAALPFELPDLASRMRGGAVYRLQLPSDAERAEALRMRARQRGFELTDEVIDYMLRRFPRGAGLFELLERIDSASLAAARRVTVPFLRSLEVAAAASASTGETHGDFGKTAPERNG